MPSLTHAEAVDRAELLHVNAYHIDLDLSAADEADSFTSTTTVRFTCARPGATTFVELKPQRLIEASLNGVLVDSASLVDNRLAISGLSVENELVVTAIMDYSITGEGLHRFRDPQDAAVYLYVQSFLDDAQRVFACFDQPDLKAPVTLTVAAPQGWEVAANAPGRQVSPQRWEFDQSQPLATYLVSLLAGPYHIVRDQHDGIPLALYCRRSLASHLDEQAPEIFEITKACLDRYHELFAVRYPFGKYDQAFVPEFNAGAMENPGLVTFRDEYVFRSVVADDAKEERAEVIAHEMAHMWFGDLVTMRWWDDLWLNESFAEYLGYRVVAEVTRFRDAWASFTFGRKEWGYSADQRPSTHPVAPDSVPDTALALLNFDGISYAKGAAVLRQLAAWIGDDAFVSGLRAHIARHAFGNATLDDLLSALSTASGRDLRAWAQVWLRVAQVNTLRPEVSRRPDGRYAAVDIVQTAAPGVPTLRPHRIGVGVYSGGTLRHRLEVDLDPTVDGRRTPVAQLVGVSPGDVLLLNDADLTYAKIRFDETSLSALRRTLPAMADPVARALVWAAAADAVKDAQWRPREFVDLCVAGLASEQHAPVFRDVAEFATEVVINRCLPEAARASARAELADCCWEALDGARPGDGFAQLAMRAWLALAGESDAHLLHGWLAGSPPPRELVMDAELRWRVVYRLAVLGSIGESDIEEEYERDRTAAGAEHAARCRAARPDPAAKSRIWRELIENDELSNRLLEGSAEGFWQPEQGHLTGQYVSDYFDQMPPMARRRAPQVALAVARLAFPRYAVTQETLDASRRLLDLPDLHPVLRRVVIDRTDDLRRALAARTLERS